jgi:hypothetical protein
LDLIETLQAVNSSFDPPETSISEPADRACLLKFREMIYPFWDTIRTSFNNFFGQIEHHDVQFVPPDGGVSPLTSNVILFLTELCPYAPILAQHPGMELATIVRQALMPLLKNLDAKAGKYKEDVVLSNLFTMNNMHYALTAIQGSTLQEVVPPDVIPAIEEKIHNAQKSYMDNTWELAFAKFHWSEKDHQDFGKIEKGKDNRVKLNKKQRMTIKHQFKAFRVKVDEINQRHQGYNLKNTKLMASVLTDAVKLVSNVYEKYWAHWKDSGFSKTPEKWIGYQPATLTSLINRLYGQDRKPPS